MDVDEKLKSMASSQGDHLMSNKKCKGSRRQPLCPPSLAQNRLFVIAKINLPCSLTTKAPALYSSSRRIRRFRLVYQALACSEAGERVNVESAMRGKRAGWILRELAGDRGRSNSRGRVDAMDVDEKPKTRQRPVPLRLARPRSQDKCWTSKRRRSARASV